jgi:general secretion pathway protein G
MQRARTRNRRYRSGFTLVEVLLVLVILGVIAAMVVPNLIGKQGEANVKATRASIAGFENACKLYAVSNNGEFPQVGGDEVINLMLNPGQDTSGRPISPYLEKPPKDAWGYPLMYEYPNTKVANATKPAIWSMGLNHQNEDGAGDDINNWTEDLVK